MAGWGAGLGWGAVRVTEHRKLRSLAAAAAWPSDPGRAVQAGLSAQGPGSLGAPSWRRLFWTVSWGWQGDHAFLKRGPVTRLRTPPPPSARSSLPRSL